MLQDYMQDLCLQCSDVVVGLSCRVDGEAPIQRVGHIADAPIKPVGVAEI